MLFTRRLLITRALRYPSVPNSRPLPQRLLVTTSATPQLTNMPNKSLDPYTAKAENNNLSPQEKIEGLHTIVNSVKTGMLTTRTAQGHLHSRAMAPTGREHLAMTRI